MLLRSWLVILVLMTVATGVYAADAACPNADKDRALEAKIAASLMAWPTPPFVALEGTQQTQFVMTQALFADVLKQREPALLVNEVDQLRFLPYTLASSSLLLILRDAGTWDENKARRVEAVAGLHQMKLSLIWLGQGESPSSLSALVEHTGGRLWNRESLMSAIHSYAFSLSAACEKAPPPAAAVSEVGSAAG